MNTDHDDITAARNAVLSRSLRGLPYNPLVGWTLSAAWLTPPARGPDPEPVSGTIICK